MSKKVVRRILIALVVLVVLIPVVSLLMLRYSLGGDHRGKHVDESFEHLFKVYPFTRQWVDSLNTAEALKDTFIVNREGKKLHAYYVHASVPTPKTAVIVHGYVGNAVEMMMIGYMFNRDLGYNILLPDLQYHGYSEGDAIQMGWKDRLDVMEWMDVARNIYGPDTQMVLHGISMGAATVMMISGEKVPGYVKCFIEDCGYTSVWDEFTWQLKRLFYLPQFPVLHTADWLCRQKHGWGFKEASSLEQVGKCHHPMLFIHGDADSYVPTSMVYPLYQAKPEPKELWIVPGATHAVAYKTNKEEYTKRVKAFTDKYIR